MKTVVKTFQQKVVGLLILLLVATSVQAQNLTVRLNGTTTVTAQSSLQNAITSSGIALGNITSLEITAGDFVTNDWNYLKTNRNSFTSMTDFTITSSVNSVADIPNTAYYQPYFLQNSIKTISIAKVKQIGEYAFYNNSAIDRTLISISLPEVTSIGNGAFYYATSLKSLALGATPPSIVNTNAFYNTPGSKYLVFVNTDGTPLQGTALTTARTTYKNINDGNSFDNLWYGWDTNTDVYQITNNAGTNGSIGINKFNAENEIVNFTINENQGYILQEGSIKVYKTGDTSTTISVNNNSFNMPAFDVTIEAIFDPKPPLLLSINNSTQKTGFSLQNALNGEALSNIDDLKIVSGIVTTEDWNYIKSISNNLTSLTDFTITNTITSVADIPDKTSSESYFKKGVLQNIIVAKIKTIGSTAFNNHTTLTNALFPDVTKVKSNAFYYCSALKNVFMPSLIDIEQNGFYYCTSLQQFALGATPPNVFNDNVFFQAPFNRFLILSDVQGNLISGANLTTARANYEAVNDGNTTDNKWYGWKTNVNSYKINLTTFSNGNIIPDAFISEANETINLTVTPDAGYILTAGTLKVYETGNINNTLTVTNNSFTMPAFNVTVEASFEAIPPLNVEINGVNKTGTSLKTLLSSETLNTITSIKVTSGIIVTEDWEYLRTNKNSFTAMTDFIVTDGISFVDDIPDTPSNQTYFNGNYIKNIEIAKVASIGNYAFYANYSLSTVSFPDATTIKVSSFQYSNNLTSAFLPKVTSIGNSAFRNCSQLNQLSLGATPPTVTSANDFYQTPNTRYLFLKNQDGSPLTGADLTNARNAYKAISDGNTSDNKWYGWIADADVYQVALSSVTNGSLTADKTVEEVGNTITLTVTPNAGYYLKENSLKVYKTGDPATSVSISATNTFTMPAYNVTVEAMFELIPPLEVTINGVTNKTGSSLQDALTGETLSTITSLEITNGVFSTTDWNYLKNNRFNLNSLTHFTITDGILSVDDIPNTYSSQSYLNKDVIENVSIAKVKTIGQYAFYNNTKLISASFPDATNIKYYALGYTGLLKNVSIPQVTNIEGYAFRNASSLEGITLGATPPTVTSNSFTGTPTPRFLVIADANGTNLSGVSLTNAQTAYQAVSDGNTSDNLWYGWTTDAYYITYTTTTNGSVSGQIGASENETIDITITPDAGYLLKSGSLKAYKTGDTNTTITITNNSFTMPAFDVTVEAIFEVKPPLLVTVNGSNNKSGSSLENALNGETLSTITSLEITSGAFTTEDWNYLKANKSSFTAMTDFTITNGIASVDDIPDTGAYSDTYLNVNVVERINVAKLKKIGLNAFRNSTSIETITFPDVLTIGQNAFYAGSGLISISFANATVIEKDAFYGCRMTSLSFPKVQNIGVNAFQATSFTTASFPEVTRIQQRAFFGSSLVSASFPKVTDIENYAFQNSSNFNELRIGATPPNVTTYYSYTPFTGIASSRFIEFIDANDVLLTGTALTDARTAYQAVNDDNATDTKWYGWSTVPGFTITYTATSNGTVTGNTKVAENETVNLTITPDTDYVLQAGSLKAYKTGEPATSVTITNNSFTMPAYDVTVEAIFEQLPLDMVVTFNNSTTVTSVASLGTAIANSGITLDNITSIEVSAGTFRTNDWDYLKNNRASFTAMTDFTITNGITSVADITQQNFNHNIIENISIAKVQSVSGFTTFASHTNLKKLSLPHITNIGIYSISNNVLLTDLNLGATPPTASNNAFWNMPTPRYLTFVDANGTPLTGTDLTNAEANYKAVSDGDTTDNLWYGWSISGAYNITYNTASNGSISGKSKATENEHIEIAIIPDTGYQLKAGSLKIYKTGDVSTTVNLTSYDTFTMPDFNVTVEAIFEVAPPLSVTINGTKTKTGTSIENILNGETFSDIISLTVTAGVFTTDDWAYLSSNVNGLYKLKYFTITDGIGSVANIPDNGYTSYPFYRYSIEKVSIAKLKSIGVRGFRNLNYLKSISLPQLSHLSDYALAGCSNLDQLNIGIHPPNIETYTFSGTPSSKHLVIVDANGNPITGTALTNAQNTYKAFSDGNTSDNLWNGWTVDPTLYTIEDISTNGEVISSAETAVENQTIHLSVFPAEGYALQNGSLKVYKTGEPSTLVTVINNRFTMPAYNVSIEATFDLQLGVSINGNPINYGSSLQDALSGTTLSTITSLEISSGNFTTSDWEYLKNQSSNMSALTSFVITSSIGSVADIADLGGGQRYFNNSVETIHISKVQSVGQYVFTGSNLTRVVLPNATTLRDGIVHPNLTRLSLGATPPSATSSSFYNTTNQRYLEYVDTNGTPLTGVDLTNAQTAYNAVTDGDTTDNLWYTWITNADYNLTYTTATNGTIEGIDKAAENQALTVTVTPDLGYELQGTLSVYKTGEPSTTVTVNSDNSFTMPAYDVTVEAVFVQLPPLQVTINGTTNKSAVLLRNVMNGENLSTITSLEITGGKFVDDDWKYLDENKGSFTAMTDFTIANSITSVENLRYFAFNKDVIQNISVAKLEKIEDHGFNRSSTLQTISLPSITYLGEHVLENCTALNQFTIGAIPPRVHNSDAFIGSPRTKNLVIVDANGAQLTGSALSNAIVNYKAISDGNVNDNLWWGWKIDTSLLNILYTNPNNGSISSQNQVYATTAGETINLIITPDAGYQLQLGSLKVYKTGDESTTVTVSGTNSFTMPAYDVTVEAIFELLPLEVTINGTTNKTGTSLQDAMNGVSLSTVTSLEISGGSFTTADWNYLKNNQGNFTAMTDFTITNTIGQVADIPDLSFSSTNRYFNKSVIENISVAKVKKVGDFAFTGSTALASASFPNATHFKNAFYDCTAITQLTLGATPPSITGNIFYNNPTQRNLVFADVDGTPLTGVALTNAITTYRAEFDYRTDDNLWYGWKIAPNLYNIFNNSTRGTVTVASGLMAGAENEVINLVITPDANFQLQAGSLKAYKTGDTSTVVTISNTNSFTMPAYDVTIEAVFELINVPFNITVNGETHLTGTSLENALSGVDLSTVISLRVNEGKFTTTDWSYLKSNKSNLSSMHEFTLGPNITSVVDIPDTTSNDPYFNTSIMKNVTMYGLKVIGENAFYGCTYLGAINCPDVTRISANAFNGATSLKTTSFKNVETIEGNAFTNCTDLDKTFFPKLDNVQADAFNGCSSLTHLNLGLTPPTNVAVGAFNNIPNANHLQFKNNDGTTPSNTDYNNAISAYRAVNDGNTNDNLWYGWIINNTNYQVTYSSGANGSITGLASQIEGETVNFTVTPDAFYQLKAGSLKAYKTGDTSTTVTLTGNSFTMPNYPVTVEGIFETTSTAITVTINGTTTKSGSSLQDVLTGETLSNITSLEVTAGIFLASDWYYLINTSNSFTSMTDFTITDGITSVADTPNIMVGQAFFKTDKIETVNIAKMNIVGNNAFKGYTALTSASFPDATHILEHTMQGCTALTSVYAPKLDFVDYDAFNGSTLLAQLTLGATPPTTIRTNAFRNLPTTRNLTLVDTNGDTLTGTALTNAQNAYKAINDGDTTDNLWYGWTINSTAYTITYDATANGTVTGINNALEGTTVNLTVSPDANYALQTGSLKVYKTGDATTTVTLTGTSFTMPAYNVTVEAIFERIPNAITYNSTTNGSISGVNQATLGSTVAITVTPDAGYQLQTGSLKVYKTGDTATTVTVTGNSFTMPAYDVTVNASFERIPNTITYNTTTNGSVSGVTSEVEGNTVNITVTPDAGYRTQAGSLKVYKTGDATTTVTLSGNSFTMPAYDVTVDATFEAIPILIEVVVNGVVNKSGASLEDVLSDVVLADITSLNVISGEFTTADWNYLKTKRSSLQSFEDLTITDNLTSVAEIPYIVDFGIKNISVAKVLNTGVFRNSTSLVSAHFPDATTVLEHGFQDCPSLTNASFPKASFIDLNAFDGASSLNQLKLGATPPNPVAYSAFFNIPAQRDLILIDANGNPLTGSDLTNAQNAYQNANDGNTSDNLWYGWRIDTNTYQVNIGASSNGTITANNYVSVENQTISLTVTPDTGYELQAGSLKVYKTGDPSTVVTLTGNTFTMPAYDVTVEAIFDQLPQLQIIVNGSVNKSGASLELALATVSIPNISSLEVVGGSFTTNDWDFLKYNHNSFTELMDFTIANTVTAVADIPDLNSGFNGYFKHDRIKTISIAKVETIGAFAFYKSSTLTSVSFPNALTVKTYAFSQCSALTTTSFPETTRIEHESFSRCDVLEKIAFPKVTFIGDEIFTNVKELSLGAVPPSNVWASTFIMMSAGNRNLVIVDPNGVPLTGSALTNAINAYKAINDGDTTDSLWWTWNINVNTWTGATNTDWNITTNWSDGVIPTASDNVVINDVANLPVIDGTTNATANNITLDDNASIFIEDNASITINGDLDLKSNAKLRVTSTIPSAGTINSGSVILGGNYTEATPNSFTYFTETHHNNDDKWSLVSSPTVGQIIDGGATGFAMYNQLQTSAKGNYGIATYDNSVANDNWNYYTITEIGQTNNIQMTSGKGYSIFPNSNASASQNKGNIRFVGAVPATDITIAVATSSGGNTNKFNLIGNPYPAFISANEKADTTNNILTTNSGILSEQTLWFWDKQTASYITVNQASKSRFIAPTQGFFVKAIDNGNFNFTKTMQVNQSAGVYNKNTNTRPEIKLTISQDGTSKNSDIFYINGTTTGFDNGYDSSIFGGTTETLNVYTNLVDTNEAMQLAIQSLPDSDYDTMVIPVGVIAEANKEVNFSANTTNLPAGIKVYLEDRLLGTFTDITTENYKVTFSDNVNGTGRFYLHTSSNALSTDSNEVVENDIVIYLANNTINISGLATEKATIMMYDLVGKEIINTTVTPQNLIQIPIPLTTSKGVYIVNIITKNGQITKKIVLK